MATINRTKFIRDSLMDIITPAKVADEAIIINTEKIKEMNKIKYIKGDVTDPVGNYDIKVVCQINNDIGAYGAGVSGAISKKWPIAEESYREWYKNRYKNNANFKPGEVKVVQVGTDIIVANMIGQKGIRSKSNPSPICYKSVESCLDKLGEWSINMRASIHMPRIGCGLAGGKWELIEPIIKDKLLKRNLEVIVYDFDQ